MKKLTTLLAFIALASVGMAATLFTAENPKPGLIDIRGNVSGKIAAVDLFSTNATGTVTLSRVFTMATYTNAVDSTTEFYTNIEDVAVFGTPYFVRDDNGQVFTNCADSVYLDNKVFYPCYLAGDGSGDFVGWCNKWEYYGDHYVDVRSDERETWTNTGWRVHLTTASQPGTGSGATAWRVWDSSYNNYYFVQKRDIDHYTPVTNVTKTVTINSITPVKARDLTVTNTVFSGTCSGNCLHAVPSPDVWIFKGDKFLFSGSATGGALRMVIE